MRSILRACYKFLPLFLGTICVILLVVALLPGRLEYYMNFDSSYQLATFSIGLLIGLPLLCILAIYEVIQIFWYRQNHHRFSGILGLLIPFFTGLSLSFDLPARLYFFTHIQQLEQALAQHTSNGSSKNFYFQTEHFIPVDSPPQMDEQHGFAYLPHPSKTYYRTTHIYGKWYIFEGQNVNFDNLDTGFKRGE
jgi:hypothetical protein